MGLNGKDNYVSLPTIHEVVKSETVSECLTYTCVIGMSWCLLFYKGILRHNCER